MSFVLISEHPEVHVIEVPFKANLPTNVYLIRDGGDSLLVDAGALSDAAIELLDAALSELGVDRLRMDVFLTDHASLACSVASPSSVIHVSAHADPKLREGTLLDLCKGKGDRLAEQGVTDAALVKFAMAAALSGTAPNITGGASADDVIGMLPKGNALSALAAWMGDDGDGALVRRFFEPKADAVRYVQDGDEVRCGTLRFTVIETRGHSDDHISLYHEPSGFLFSGDAVLEGLSSSIDLLPRNQDGAGLYLSSLRRLRSMPQAQLLVGHGRPPSDLQARLNWLIVHHERRLDDVVRIAEESPMSTGYEICRKIRWSRPPEKWREVPIGMRYCMVCEGLAILRHLERCGVLYSEEAEGGIRRWTACLPHQALFSGRST